MYICFLPRIFYAVFLLNWRCIKQFFTKTHPKAITVFESAFAVDLHAVHPLFFITKMQCLLRPQ